MIAPRLVMILASAGSGKTYALTNRFIALLAAGAAPERMVALTFTRKAAGEFFDEILRKLAAAADDAVEAHGLAEAIKQPHLATADFLRLLRGMTDALHRLRLGTLDSFFAQIARAFPFELGLSGDFEVIEGHAATRERERALRQLFVRAGELDEAQKDFLEAFKQATFGTEEKRLARSLDRFLEEKYETFLEAPEREPWGNVRRIWPAGQPWLAQLQVLPAVNALRRWLAGAAMTDTQRTRWEAFAAEIAEWLPGAVWSAEMDYLLPKALERWTDLVAGRAEIVVAKKKQALDPAGCAALADIVRVVAGGELRRQVEVTQGVHAVLSRYDSIYSSLVRRAGKLTFGDVVRLLQPAASRPLLSFGGEAGDRLLLDYRLDAAVDHWLLDEFQDTSRGQWGVLQNLIDEVVQDAEGRRTFFCVGDVKQSIYGWRSGDPTLMGDIRRHYNGGGTMPGPIETAPLDASWRSGPAIIEMVNTVFGAHATISGLFPGTAAERWREAWRRHTTEKRDRDGQAALLFASDADGRQRLTLELIQEIDPLARGLTCAVLVRSNDQAAAVADFLRREGGIPALAEADLHVCVDHPAGAALLALVQAAAHPADTLAWEHVQMTPLAASLAKAGLTTREDVTRHVLRVIHEEGFELLAERWSAPEAGAFARERARQFAGAAALFDATGRRDPDEFIQFMSRYTVREPESSAVVRVMTIHKSKGLGFDVVILPELQGKKLNPRPCGLAVHRIPGAAAEWVLELPRSELSDADEILRAHCEGAAHDSCYEALSLLYVAMTRAKRAMFAVIEAPKENSKSNNYPKLLVDTLGAASRTVRVGTREFAGSWSAGNPAWFEGMVAAPIEAAPEKFPLVSAPAVPRRSARRPSGERSHEMGANRLFAFSERPAVEFGREVHALLAAVEWAEAGDVAKIVSGWRTTGANEEAIAAAAACLQAPALAPVWRAPADRALGEVWRERAFEIVLDGAWVTGVFDRVVVRRDERGRTSRATVYDFKTDRVSGDLEISAARRRHEAQLQIYRRVAGVLLGIEPGRIDAEIVFLAPGRVVALAAVSS